MSVLRHAGYPNTVGPRTLAPGPSCRLMSCGTLFRNLRSRRMAQIVSTACCLWANLTPLRGKSTTGSLLDLRVLLPGHVQCKNTWSKVQWFRLMTSVYQKPIENMKSSQWWVSSGNWIELNNLSSLFMTRNHNSFNLVPGYDKHLVNRC